MRVTIAGMVAALLGATLSATPVAASALPSVLQMTVYDNDPYTTGNQWYAFSNTPIDLAVSFPQGTTTPAPTGTLTLTYATDPGGPWTEFGSLIYPGTGQLRCDCNPGFELATLYYIHGEYTPDSDAYSGSAANTQMTFTKGFAYAQSIAHPETIDTNTAFELDASMYSYSSKYRDGTTVSFRRNDSDEPLCTSSIGLDDHAKCTVASLPVGTFQITGDYSGNEWVNGQSSDPVTITVTPDTVHASGVGIQWTTFYPVADNWKDKVRIWGSRDEPLAVTIKIYSPSNALIKTVTFPEASGSYAYDWNGRYSTGKVRPEGKYKIVQTLKDHNGNTQVVTSYTNLSKKFLHWTTKDLTVKGSDIDNWGAGGAGTVTLNHTSGYAKLRAPTKIDDWAAVAYEFRLPSASIYSWWKVRVYTRHSGSNIATYLRAWDFNECPADSGIWYLGCFGDAVAIPTTSGTSLYWRSTPSLPANFRYGRIVRSAVSSAAGTTYVYKARLSVRYAYLAY